jgi:hypothetical protein
MAKNININLNFNSLGSKLKSSLGLLLLAMLVALLVLEFFVVKNSVKLISAANAEPDQVTAKGVRVNFVNYDAVTQKIDSAATYLPPSKQLANPFAAH